jgi:hypothetical protein
MRITYGGLSAQEIVPFSIKRMSVNQAYDLCTLGPRLPCWGTTQ